MLWAGTGAATLLASLMALIVAWIASGRVYREGLLPGAPRGRPRAEIVALDEDRVTLQQRGKRPLKTEGLWGLEAPRGFARLSHSSPIDARTVAYAYDVLDGELRLGDECTIEAATHPLAGGAIPGLTEVTYPTPLGPFPGWQAPGDRERWLICVHGQSGGPRETLRVAEVGRRLGRTVLVLSYRNDPGVPPTEDGLYHLGRIEWRDLDAAVQYAHSSGATEITLSGHSMGAAIVLWFMRESALARSVRALVLDSPLLDFREAASWTGRTTGVPVPVLGLALGIAARRFRLDWRDYDVRPHFDSLDVPVLLFHGDRDGQVPIALSEEVAARRPDIVAFERIPRAGHCQPWNVDPERYEQTLAAFLESTAGRSDRGAAETLPAAAD